MKIDREMAISQVKRMGAKIAKQEAELAEAREIIADECAAHFSTDDETPCFCGLCNYHHNQEAPK